MIAKAIKRKEFCGVKPKYTVNNTTGSKVNPNQTMTLKYETIHDKILSF